MAIDYGGGAFAPSESTFKTPGVAKEAFTAEARKRAYYLSSMDQFYAQLDEAQSQFDQTLEFKTTTRDLELGFAREKLGVESKIAHRGLDIQESLGWGGIEAQRDIAEGQLGLGYEKIGADRERTGVIAGAEAGRLSLGYAEFGLEQEKLGYKGRLFDKEMDLFDTLTERMGGGSAGPQSEAIQWDSPTTDSGPTQSFNYGMDNYDDSSNYGNFGY